MRHAHAVIAAVALFAAACHSPRSTQPSSSGGAQKLDPSTPVAKVGGQTINAGELDEAVKRDLNKLEQSYQERVYEIRKQALDGMIRKRLVEAKAKAQGVTPEELLQKTVVAKSPEPNDAEIQALYERAKAGGQQLPPLDQVKPDIAKFIKQQKSQQAMNDFYEELKKEANVEVLLPPYLPPKVVVAAEGPSKGPQSAPVTIVEFSDFQCPFCVKAEGTVKDLLTAYPEKIRLVYRDFPLPFHKNAQKAAEASHCAADQGKYWEMHDKLFSSQEKLALGDLKGYARDLGLDGAKFDRCLDSGDKGKVVDGSKKAGEEAGVSGTPAFFINGRMLSGAQPLESFKQIVDQEIATPQARSR